MADNVTRAQYVASGPFYDDETNAQAMGENTAWHLAGHMLTRRARPGHGLEHEPVDDAERAAQHTAQNAATFDHATTARAIRAALRPQ